MFPAYRCRIKHIAWATLGNAGAEFRSMPVSLPRVVSFAEIAAMFHRRVKPEI
jgi:hypothetical protein